MAITGYNPNTVTIAISNIKSSYSSVISALITKSLTSFVSPMGACWGSPQAVAFFTSYKTAVEAMSNDVTKVYQSIVDSMNSAANNLAKIAGSSWATIGLETSSKELIISAIKQNLSDGTIGIDVTQARTVAGQLDGVLASIKDGLDKATSAVKNSGFVGGEMQSSLVSSLTKIEANISNQFSDLKNQVNTAIQDTVDTYTATSTNVSNAFGGGSN